MTMAMKREEETIPETDLLHPNDMFIGTIVIQTATHLIGTATTIAIDTTNADATDEATATTINPPTALPLVG